MFMGNNHRALKHSKRGVMGIGTLIIFIAMILVAAVAAAVVISTSNILQQRSLLVGQEARKSITDAIQIISIMAESNSSSETFNNYEILIQLSPGSDSLQMRKFDLQYISQTFDQGADLMYVPSTYSAETFTIVNSTGLHQDFNDDGIEDVAWLNITSGNDYIRFNISKIITSGYYVYEQSDWVALNQDLSTTGNVLYLNQVPVNVSSGIAGYFSALLNTTGDDILNGSMSFSLYTDECDFSRLPPETKYCYKVMNGNSDYVLNPGERFKILYKVKPENEISTGADFGFIFISEKGRLTEARARTPDVVVEQKAKLWPIG